MLNCLALIIIAKSRTRRQPAPASPGSHWCKSGHFSYLGRVPYGIRPVQYDVRTAWYNCTRWDGTTYAEMLLSRNGTKTGWYIILAYDVTLSVRCSNAWLGIVDVNWIIAQFIVENH